MSNEDQTLVGTSPESALPNSLIIGIDIVLLKDVRHSHLSQTGGAESSSRGVGSLFRATVPPAVSFHRALYPTYLSTLPVDGRCDVPENRRKSGRKHYAIASQSSYAGAAIHDNTASCAARLPSGVQLCGNPNGHRFRPILDERREIDLPEDATIDTSFQQSNVRVRAGNGRAQSNLQAKNIPKGIYIIPFGSALYDTGWAVSAPELKTVGEPAQYRFGMKLYCTSSSSPEYTDYGGCEANVYVCYKPKN